MEDLEIHAEIYEAFEGKNVHIQHHYRLL
jgi:hypothetical protein